MNRKRRQLKILAHHREVLGVGPEADTAQIRTAFRIAARLVHPDLNPGLKRGVERFQEVVEARDALLKIAPEPIQPEPDPHEAKWRLNGIEHRDGHLIYHLDVDRTSLEPGVRATLPHRHQELCSNCHGRGLIYRFEQDDIQAGYKSCPRCTGRGRRERLTEIVVPLPPRLDGRAQIRISGQGELKPGSDKRGDLHLILKPTLLRGSQAA